MFTGLYRLGRRTASSFLHSHPDIVVNAKLLTGGLLPLCTTAASDDIFAAFDSPHKHDALLHGHSYTANAVGCSVAVKAVTDMAEMERKGAWEAFVRDWEKNSGEIKKQKTESENESESEKGIWSSWSHDLVRDLSFAEEVESIFALGTVLSITLKDREGGGGMLFPFAN